MRRLMVCVFPRSSELYRIDFLSGKCNRVWQRFYSSDWRLGQTASIPRPSKQQCDNKCLTNLMCNTLFQDQISSKSEFVLWREGVRSSWSWQVHLTWWSYLGWNAFAYKKDLIAILSVSVVFDLGRTLSIRSVVYIVAVNSDLLCASFPPVTYWDREQPNATTSFCIIITDFH